MGKLTVEAFEGIGKLTPMTFNQYRLIGKGKIDNVYQVINKAKYAMHSSNYFKPVFIKDDMLYTLEEFKTIPNLDEVDIKLNKSEVLNIEDNTDIYSKVVEYYINFMLGKVKVLEKYKKYKTQNTDEIISNTILTRNLRDEFKKSEKGFMLKRKFKIKPVVNKEGNVILYLSCSSDFSINKNIYQMINEGLDVIGLPVKNIWNNIRGNAVI